MLRVRTMVKTLNICWKKFGFGANSMSCSRRVSCLDFATLCPTSPHFATLYHLLPPFPSLCHTLQPFATFPFTLPHFTLPSFATLPWTSPNFAPLRPTLTIFEPLRTTLNHFEPFWTTSNPFKPLRTVLNHFEPLRTPSNHFELLQTTSNYFEPLQTTSNHFEPLRTTSNHFEPLRTTSNRFKPLRPTSPHFSTALCEYKSKSWIWHPSGWPLTWLARKRFCFGQSRIIFCKLQRQFQVIRLTQRDSWFCIDSKLLMGSLESCLCSLTKLPLLNIPLSYYQLTLVLGEERFIAGPLGFVVGQQAVPELLASEYLF